MKSGEPAFATREELINVLTRYEGAIQRANDEGDEAADKELTEARDALMDLLQQVKVVINEHTRTKT